MEMISCPFCGGETSQHPAKIFAGVYYFCDHKHDCFIRDKAHILNAKEQIEAWNRRAGIKKPPPSDRGD